jgi:pimeloyl-ACP methyl ester carboxylesterase
MKRLKAVAFALAVSPALVAGAENDRSRLLSIDHYVRVKSTVPSIAGQLAHIYVRERVSAGVLARGAAGNRVALFVHGAGTPAEVAFDVPTGDFSWMAHLANAGFDVFSMDTTGYGRSTRPPAMDDPCNLSNDQQALFVPALISAPCPATYPGQLTNIGSDWNDIGAAVDYIRALRRVDKISLLAWSLGGPRAGGYAWQHPEKVDKLVLLAPAYNRAAEAAAPQLPRKGTVFNTQSRSEFIANWDRQVGCDAQYDTTTRDAVWSELLASDPVGATCGTGVRRAPSTTTWGWNQAAAGKMMMPTLLIAGIHDKQVNPASVKNLYDDLGATEKVMIDLGCSSHNAMWEKNHLLMFNASLEWLTTGMLGETKQGIVKLGY